MCLKRLRNVVSWTKARELIMARTDIRLYKRKQLVEMLAYESEPFVMIKTAREFNSAVKKSKKGQVIVWLEERQEKVKEQ